jgi:hypothetical protein
MQSAVVYGRSWTAARPSDADIAYVAAANPAVMLDLLAMLAEAKAEGRAEALEAVTRETDRLLQREEDSRLKAVAARDYATAERADSRRLAMLAVYDEIAALAAAPEVK